MKAEETDRQTDRQTNKQTMPTQSPIQKKCLKMNKFLLCSYIIVKRNANTTDSIGSRIKN